MNELHGATAFISAFVNTGCVHNSALDYTEDEKISGISGIPFVGNGGGSAEVPWISGNKYIGPEVLLDWGDAVQYISSFTVSGDHNHAIALKGSQFKLPSTANIQDKLDEKLFISSFSSYTAAADSRMDGIFQLANSAYTTAVNNFYNKADISAISSWSGDIEYISGQVSGLDDQYYPLTSNPSGYLTAHQDLSDYATTAQLESVSSEITGMIPTALTGEYLTKDSADTLYYPLTGNPSGFLTEHQSLTAYLTKDSADTLYQPTGNYLTAVPANYATSGDVTGTAQWALTTAGWEKITAAEGDYELSAGDGISIVDYPEDQKTVISVTGGGTEYSAGQYIDISTADVISVTGLQPAGSYQPAGNYVSSTTFSNYTATADAAAYTAGSNINITNHVISGKDWGSTISAASAYAASQATGKEYLGVLPIVVNNTTDQISAQTMELIAGDGIEFVTASTSTTINCTATGGGGSTYEISYNSPATGFTGNSGLVIAETIGLTGSTRKVMSGERTIGELVPSGYNTSQYLTTNAVGNMQWSDIPDLGVKVTAVATSAQATAGFVSNVLYIVTGN